jgi:uroporphyrin-III C-methyltransferase/precorrin-2 dehydrogenase/sirohydrochlorin ferrochelatase
MYLPLLFKADGLRCLIIGGGEVATEKIGRLSPLPCSLTLIAPDVTQVIRELVDRSRIRCYSRKYRSGDCRGFQLVIAATGDRAVNQAVSEEARGLGIPVNVVDDPELCTAVFPAVLREGPLTLAVGTGGKAPFMAAALRNCLAEDIREMGDWVELAARFREIVRREIEDPAAKNRLYRRFVEAGPPESLTRVPKSDRLAAWLEWLENRGQLP